MLDKRGRLIRVGDRLDVGCGWAVGVVVASMDSDEYSLEHPREAWAYLERGVMIETDKAGLIHYTDRSRDDLEIIDPISD